MASKLSDSMVAFECCRLLIAALSRVPVRCRYSSGPPLPGFHRSLVDIPLPDLTVCMDDLSRVLEEPIERLAANIVGTVEWDAEAVFHRVDPSTISARGASATDPHSGVSVNVIIFAGFADRLAIWATFDVVPLPWRPIHRERNLRMLESYEAANA